MLVRCGWTSAHSWSVRSQVLPRRYVLCSAIATAIAPVGLTKVLCCLQAVGAFALSLPLAALELAVRDVVNAAASSDRHGHEEQALALAETLLDVGGRKQSTAALALVQHAEFDARRLPRWAKLLDEATALVVRSVPVSSAVDGAPQVTPGRLARAKRVLETASVLLSSLPALRSARTEARGSDGGAASTVAALV